MGYQQITLSRDVSETFEDVALQWTSGDLITSATVRLTHLQTRSSFKYINVESLVRAQELIDMSKSVPMTRVLILNQGAVNETYFYYNDGRTRVSAEIVYPTAPGLGYTINVTTYTTNTTAEQL